MKEDSFGIRFLKVINLYNQGIYLDCNRYLYYVQNPGPICQVQLISVEFHDVEHKKSLTVALLCILSDPYKLLSMPSALKIFGLGLSSGKM